MRRQILFSKTSGLKIEEVFYSKNNTQIVVLFVVNYYSVIDFNDENLVDHTVFEEDLSLWGIE